MFVYCGVEDCTHCEDGMCENVWPIGTHAISVEENYMGIPFCTDFKQREEQEEKPQC